MTGKEERMTKDGRDEEKTETAWMCGDDDWYIVKDAAAVRQE